ncbi:MAG: c-type cytochrome [Verrucomicrobia bacterium]|nr:c-type cytochrome [Verrucomicrobiota bacterium]
MIRRCFSLLITWLLLPPACSCLAQDAQPEVTDADLPRRAPLEPAEALKAFKVKPGFEVQLVAAEPLVMDPIAMDFDENGRLFVVEMRDYSERRDDKLGRIRVLEDPDGDGVYDRSTVFAEGLGWPTAVVCWKGGIFVGRTPDILFLEDRDGDLRADSTKVVFTGFAVDTLSKLNVQALLNSFRWGLDNRIHGSSSLGGGTITSPQDPTLQPVPLRGRDFSFDPRTLDFRLETGGGQHGMSFDDFGRKFLCSNSDHLQAVLVHDRYLKNIPPGLDPPPTRESIAADGPAAPVFRISPDEPWRIIRTRWRVTGAVPGIIEGGGRASGYFTGATGATIYRGNAFPSDYLGDAFIADCGSNLIHRKRVKEHRTSFTAERAQDELTTEFVASTDNWHRPVQFANAPDGTLWVADMYRETIEHPWSIPENLKKRLDLNSGWDRGRIYRVAPKGFRPPRSPQLGKLSPEEWVALLEHPNGWHRDTASRLIFQSQDASVAPRLETLALSSALPAGRMHALRSLEGLGMLKHKHITAALKDPSPKVRELAVQLVEKLSHPLGDSIWNQLEALARDSDLRIRCQVAWTAGSLKQEGGMRIAAVLMSKPPEPELIVPTLRAAGSFLSAWLLQQAREGSNVPSVEWLGRIGGVLGADKTGKGLEVVEAVLKSWAPSDRTIVLLTGAAGGAARAGLPFLPWVEKESIQPHLRAGLEQAGDMTPNVSPDRRVLGLELAAWLPWSLSRSSLLQALGPQQPPSVGQVATRAITRSSSSEAAQDVLKAWDGINPGNRALLVDWLCRHPDRSAALLESVNQGRVQRTELTVEQVMRLRGSSHQNLRQLAIKIFGDASKASRQGQVNNYLPALALQGNPAKGSQTYQQRCVTCHRKAGAGHAVGPDLESVQGAGKEKLLTHILDPNREVAPVFLAHQVELKSGDTLSGLLVSETADAIRIRQAGGLETAVNRAEIKHQSVSGLSLMPEGLEEGLSPADMADLLEFLTQTTN